ncbi:MAG TPA: hypothetical protein VNE39_00650 [Planctomycetota bacterium]|nr:hypothetical protein [Planctomycetota bacterium]
MMSGRVAAALFAGLAALCGVAGEAPPQGQVAISWITVQKPQSKLWHDQGTWWAALPQDKGVYLWRYAAGRLERQEKPGPLKGTGANAECDAVLHGKTLFVLAFQKDAKEIPLHALAFSEGAYKELPGYPVALQYLGGASTVTCDVDSKGTLWVACVDEKAEVAVQSLAVQDPAAGFTPRQVLAASGRYDIAAVAAFKGHVGVLWCHQKPQRLLFRAHRDGDPPGQWGPEEVIASEKGVANDHINLAADAVGNLWAVTKHQSGPRMPPVQFSLRRRNAEGKWDKAFPVIPPGQNRTRPIVVLDGEKPFAYVVYTDRMVKPWPILIRRVSLDDGKLGEETKVLAADYDLNNATDCKATVTTATGLMVLAGPHVAKTGPARLRLLPLEDLRR